MGSTTVLGADRNAIGFYRATPHATYFTQDSLNPAGEPRALFYAGTGFNTGSLWLTWEAGGVPGSAAFQEQAAHRGYHRRAERVTQVRDRRIKRA